MLDSESITMLIKAVRNYIGELNESKKLLMNAAEVCDAAMGSDDLSKKYITQLSESLKEIDEVAIVAADIIEQLEKDYYKADDILGQ